MNLAFEQVKYHVAAPERKRFARLVDHLAMAQRELQATFGLTPEAYEIEIIVAADQYGDWAGQPEDSRLRTIAYRLEIHFFTDEHRYEFYLWRDITEVPRRTAVRRGVVVDKTFDWLDGWLDMNGSGVDTPELLFEYMAEVFDDAEQEA